MIVGVRLSVDFDQMLHYVCVEALINLDGLVLSIKGPHQAKSADLLIAGAHEILDPLRCLLDYIDSSAEG